jgi:L-asparagine oxygenase
MSFIQLASHRLDDVTRDLLGKEIAERVAATELDPDAQEAILAGIGAHALSRYLPGEILNALNVFSATGRHALLLSNLPTPEFPPTPVSGFGHEADLADINALHFGLIQMLGVTPFAVDYENQGRLIRNVVPNPAASGTTSSWGADMEFFWHTDNPQLPFGEPGTDPRLSMPRYLTFYVVRNEERIPTDVAAIEDALRRVDEPTRTRLHANSFDVGAPASNDADPESPVGRLTGTAILEQAGHGTHVRYDRGTTRARTPEAAAALDAWSHALADIPRRELVLAPGDFLIFDNYRVLHRRREFTPAPATRARWLRRCYAS